MDLLGTIVNMKLKGADFATFNVTEALEVIKADIMEEIGRANRGCSAADLVFYFSKNFPVDSTQGVLLIAECLADYYRTGELIVTKYIGEKYGPVEHYKKSPLQSFLSVFHKGSISLYMCSCYIPKRIGADIFSWAEIFDTSNSLTHF